MAILERKHDSVDINGDVCESGFNIMASAEAFEILSDRIYPNKIKAVVRELSTNAVDATIDAWKVSKLHSYFNTHSVPQVDEMSKLVNDNTDYLLREMDVFNDNPSYDLSNWVEQPPLVHLPNRIEPWFSVRDYGTGLSHDFIMKLYTTYFWSDKKTSNDYTGCLGLGSKSPFAYTDHFTVTSYFNGEKRMYNAHLSNGFPSISIFLDDDGTPLVFPTDEPNGIEVQFGVKAEDFDEFADEARRLYPYFKMQPKVVGNSNVSSYLETVRKSKEDDTYYTIHNKETIEWGFRRTGEHSGPLAIMGNIAYPISLVNKYSLDSVTQKLLSSNIDIVFPVGSLQITPSREQLSYKPSTVQTIEIALKQIGAELAGKFSEKIQSANNLWEARCLASELFHIGEFQGFVSLLSLNKIEWHGQELGSTLHINLEQEKGITTYQFSLNNRKKKVEVKTLPLNRNLILYDIDLPRGSFTRLEILAGQTGKHIYACEFADRVSRDKLVELMGLPSNHVFPGTSSLPKPTVEKRASYASDAHIFKYSQRGWVRRQYERWNQVGADFDLSDGGIYVEMFRYKILDRNDKPIDAEKVGDMLKALVELGDSTDNIIGVRKRLVKQFVRSDDWVDLHTYCEKFLQLQLVKDNVAVKIADLEEMNRLIYKDTWLSLLDKIDTLNEGTLKTFLLKVKEVNDSANSLPHDISTYKTMAYHVGHIITGSPTHNALREEVLQLLIKYPMLKYVAMSSEYVGLDVVNYINTIDKN